MDIINNMKSILKHSFCIFAIVFCVSATPVAHAKTIDSNYTYLDSSRLEFFNNIFLRTSFNSYLLASEVITSGYSNYTNYYFCLSNDLIDTNDVLNTNLNCDEFYRYYRVNNNEYTIEKITDDKLIVNNSIYYSNSIETKSIPIKAYLLAILVGLFTIWLSMILFKVFRSW